MARAKRQETIVAERGEFKPDAYIVRTCGKNGESYNGWRYPMSTGAMVECPDWHDRAECGGGFHGLLDGIGDWSLVEVGPARVWQVFHVMRSEVVVIDDAKVKFPRGLLVYVGNVAGAMNIVQPATIARIQAEAKKNIATGDRGHAAATGDRGHAAATGDSGHAAATGKHSIAVSLGVAGTALAGPDGWLVLAQWGEWNGDERPLICVKTAKVGGPEGIRPNVAYCLNERGEFEEARP